MRSFIIESETGTFVADIVQYDTAEALAQALASGTGQTLYIRESGRTFLRTVRVPIHPAAPKVTA